MASREVLHALAGATVWTMANPGWTAPIADPERRA